MSVWQYDDCMVVYLIPTNIPQSGPQEARGQSPAYVIHILYMERGMSGLRSTVLYIECFQ